MEPQGRRGRFGSCAMQATLMSGSEPPSDHNLPEIPLEDRLRFVQPRLSKLDEIRTRQPVDLQQQLVMQSAELCRANACIDAMKQRRQSDQRQLEEPSRKLQQSTKAAVQLQEPSTQDQERRARHGPRTTVRQMRASKHHRRVRRRVRDEEGRAPESGVSWKPALPYAALVMPARATTRLALIGIRPAPGDGNEDGGLEQEHRQNVSAPTSSG